MMRSIPNTMGLFLCLMLLAGCGGDNGTDGGSPAKGSKGDAEAQTESGGETASADPPKIAFVTNQIAAFWNIAAVGARDAAADFGAEAVVKFPPEATATKQKQIIEDLFSAGIDALAVSPIDAENQLDMVNEWCDKVPTLTHDSDAPGTKRIMYIGMDNYRAGRMVGKLIKEAYPEGAEMVITIGRLEQDNAKKRRQGVIDELMERTDDPARFDPVEGEIRNDQFVIHATLTDQGDSTVAKRKAEDALNTYPELDLFVGLFEYNPPACLEAIKQANRTGQVKVAGFDENAITLQGIKDGTVIGTVVQNPYEYGYQSVRILKQILDGDRSAVPESGFIDIAARAVTSDGRLVMGVETENVDDFWTDLKSKVGQDN